MDTHCAAGLALAPSRDLTGLRYRMTADADPGLLPRVLQVFAKRSVVPDAVRAERRSGGLVDGDDILSLELHVPAMPAAKARHVAACLRETVGVRSVHGPDHLALVMGLRR